MLQSQLAALRCCFCRRRCSHVQGLVLPSELASLRRCCRAGAAQTPDLLLPPLLSVLPPPQPQLTPARPRSRRAWGWAPLGAAPAASAH